MSLPAINLDTEFNFSAFTLPSFPDISTTPSRHASRRVSGRNSRVFESSSPGRINGRDEEVSPGRTDEKVSSLDPRRLTPNLHATLVSEILNLRHEVQSKSKDMLGLEESLSASREENLRLNRLVTDHARDTKLLKHQMKELEGGTMSALDEMAADRDRAIEQAADLKKRLEASHGKVKQHADEVNRTNVLWEKDQEKWSMARRALDHKVSVAEGRLQAVLKEFEAVQAMHQHKKVSEIPDRSQSRASGRHSATSMRRDSSASSDGGRRNRLSHISEIDRPSNAGTLADELALDDDDYDAEDDFLLDAYSPDALPEEHRLRPRPFSAQSHRQSAKAFKLLGLAVEGTAEEDEGPMHPREGSDTRRFAGANVPALDSDSQSQYSDNATQYSPPPTPKAIGMHTLDTITEASSLYTLEDAGKDHGSESMPPLPPAALRLRGLATMVSSAVQTMEPPPSPPDTPVEGKRSDHKNAKTDTCSVAIQTEEPAPQKLQKNHTGTLDVPVIAIHRPNSSQSNHGVVLPPHTKSISCQVHITVPQRSTGMQTEEIRIDQRAIKLPAHLLPSAISSKPSSPVPEKQKTRSSNEPAKHQRARATSPARTKASKSSKRSLRDSRRNSTEQIPPADGYVSDDSFISREPVKKTLSRVRDSWQVLPASQDGSEPDETGSAVIYGSNDGSQKAPAASKPKEAKAGKPLHINTVKADIMRRSALVASGSAAHIQRARSPSLPTLPSTQLKSVEPPFPVPDRSSSRKFPWEGSDGTASPTLQSVSFFGGDQENRRARRPPVKKPGLRKIRSETEPYALVHTRSRSRSPPPTSASSFTELESLNFPVPPLPNDDINSPFRLPSEQKASHQRDDSVANSAADSAATNESIHVVDAIAQTMIGEWMWKYTRRRKSFGLTGSTDDFDSRARDGDSLRHQRWVWLAPCERAVLWSSKPPVSSSALQGRLGHRKLEIQSVLDVRDDAPMPRGAEPASCFGRSILILTPQRALKFTAMSRERHYLWLSALSFLSQPGAVPADFGVPPVPSLAEFTAPPPPSRGQIERNKQRAGVTQRPAPPQPAPAVAAAPAPAPASKPVTAFLRRHPVRDSIRVAKSKARPSLPQGGRRAHTDPSLLHGQPPMPNVPARLSDAAVTEQAEDSDPGAEPPHVPRTAAHTRKRSNTGPRTATSFRSLNSSQNGRGGTNGKTPSGTTAGSHGSYGKNPPNFARPTIVTRWPPGSAGEPQSAGAADVPSAGYSSSRYNSMARSGNGSGHSNGNGSAGLMSPTSARSISIYEDAMVSPPLSTMSSVQAIDSSGTMRMDAFVRDTLGGGAGGGAGSGSGKYAGGKATKMWKEPWSAGAVEGRVGMSGSKRGDAGMTDPFYGF